MSRRVGSGERTQDRPLAGRGAIVTGAAGGIGRATAERFLEAGARVVCIDLPGRGLEATFDACEAAAALEHDIAAPDCADLAVQRALGLAGRLDILVNNAAVCLAAPIETLSDADWQRSLDVNLTAAFRLCRAAVPQMRRTGGGRIINLGSIMSTRGLEGLAAYGATKHAMAGLTRALAVELGPAGITANFLAPGVIETGLLPELKEDEAFRSDWSEKTPARRLGTPEEVADAALFLASDAGRFVNGHGLAVDGGLAAGL